MMFETNNLRGKAVFRTEISKDLYWVPCNCLGMPRYTCEEILEFTKLNAYQKQQKRLNLFEAIQLFQYSGFKDVIDVKRLQYGQKVWEHHKPGYFAVTTNCGCCSSIAAWLSFILKYSYDNKGYLLFNRPDGSGHVMNYIFFNNNYYIIDLSTMTIDNCKKICVESGDKRDYLKSLYATSILFETSDLHSFCKYHNRLHKTRGYDLLYYTIDDCEYIPPTYSIKYDSNAEIVHSFGAVFMNSSSQITHTYESDAPNYSPNWNYNCQ